jgi:DNA-binding HxlR family transcriptional regulator
MAPKKLEKNVCPIAKVVDFIGDHWTMLIIRDLLTGPKRFGDLETSLAGVSSRTLVKKLECLSENKFITRKSFRETPPRVEYSLTKKGAGLHGIAEAMRKYGEKHL